jgi:hypothetical protein
LTTALYQKRCLKKRKRKMKKILERLDQAILEVIDSPQLTQQTTAIGTLF